MFPRFWTVVEDERDNTGELISVSEGAFGAADEVSEHLQGNQPILVTLVFQQQVDQGFPGVPSVDFEEGIAATSNEPIIRMFGGDHFEGREVEDVKDFGGQEGGEQELCVPVVAGEPEEEGVVRVAGGCVVHPGIRESGQP